MILVGTTVVVDCLRTSDVKLLALLQTSGVGICGVVRAEILCGARDAAHRNKLTHFVDSLSQVDIPSSLWDLVGDNLADLRKSGVTVPFQEAVLATLAIAMDVELWGHDRHLPFIQKVLPSLRLFQYLIRIPF